MALIKRELKGLIEYSDLRNQSGRLSENDVVGVSINKSMITTKADLNDVNLKNYKLLRPNSFAFIAVTSRNGNRFSIAYNNTDRTFIVSTWYVVFSINEIGKDVLLPEYLFLYFNRAEFDRYARINSWGSAREYFWFSDLEDVELEIPSISIQQKYVDIYKAMVANQQSYERGLEDLKIACESLMDKLKAEHHLEKIGNYIKVSDIQNTELTYGVDSVKGISIEKKFIETKANMAGVNLKPYYLVHPNEVAYVTVTSRNGGKISIALNDSNETYLCSSSYVVFRSKDSNKLLPRYLMLYLSRPEFDRYARFNSWGSARETFDWSEMCNVQIPIPDISIQKAIADIYATYIDRKRINEQLKAQIKDICPILIRGSLEE